MAPLTARVTKGAVTLFLKPFGVALFAVGVAFALSELLASQWQPRNVLEICLFAAVIGMGHAAICLTLLDRPLLARLTTAALAAWRRKQAQFAPGSFD